MAMKKRQNEQQSVEWTCTHCACVITDIFACELGNVIEPSEEILLQKLRIRISSWPRRK